ncbi:Wzz/FepE/Etk N-terminal domain-containing protein [Mucilaginibacter ginkgonis]|uniref:Lipopolysaccharide biosynthesis protein n=1 Tax=Mucilaginibacter ginkgonis TaxID=2682091 RepID=A0A6I4I1Y4_9SPHI|nr:Wzz/FepE/Etk N-terminal domain-containing protein [Mucilaginibacter ginkgonis]QQL50844.1 lipopolysaccharide biosynthesis protein [Mucilaginibacter ginkgonis]
MPDINYPKNFESKDEISFKEIFAKLKLLKIRILKSWITIFICAFIFAGLGYGYSLLKGKKYVATTTFVLESPEGGGSNLGQFAGIASMAGLDVGGNIGGLFQADNILELYRSRKMLKETLLSPLKSDTSSLIGDRFVRINHWEKLLKSDSVSVNFRDALNLDSLPPKKQVVLNRLITAMASNIDAKCLTVDKPNKKSSVINISVSSTDEIFSKEFNDRLVENVNNFYIKTKTSKALQSVTVFKQQADSVRNILNSSLYNVAAVTDATPNLNPTKQVLRVPIQRSQVNADANKAMLAEMVKNLEASRMMLRQETPLIQIIDKPVYPLQTVELARLFGVIFGFIIGIVFALVLISIRFVFTDILKND